MVRLKWGMLTPARRGTAWPIVPALAVLFAACLSVLAGAQETAPDSCNLETSERIVAVADVHGGYDRFVGILRTAGLIDNRERWAGGRAVFVQTGDVLDRGPDSRRAMDLIRRLSSEAARAGGRVHALLGQSRSHAHAGRPAVRERRRVRGVQVDRVRDAAGSVLRGRRRRGGRTARRAPGRSSTSRPSVRRSWTGRLSVGSRCRLRSDPKATTGSGFESGTRWFAINGIVFVHGGISPAVAALGCAKVNATVRSDLAALRRHVTPAQVAAQAVDERRRPAVVSRPGVE